MSEDYTSYLDFYRRGPFAPYLKEHRLAGSAALKLFTAAQPAGEYPDAGTPDYAICMPLRIICRSEIDLGAGRRRGRSAVGDICVIAPGTPTDFRVQGAHEILGLSIPADVFGPLFAEVAPAPSDFGRLHAAPFRDSFIQGLCRRLWDEAARNSPSGSLFVDSAVHTLALALLRRAELAGAEPEPARGTPLAPWRLRRCLDYLGDNLDRDLGLPELAAAAGLSPLYFAKAFKRATGTAPHRYLIGRRIERAKALLADTDLSIAEVALACGFANQSHMGEAFRRAVGTSPGAYRRGE